MYVGEYLERTPLGKAEWIVPIGELFDRREDAERIFDGVAARYEALREEAAAFAEGVPPRVMLNAPYRDVWFVPGDRSYMVSLIDDAGGEYVFAGEDSSVSRPVGIEEAYMAARKADVWLNPNQARTLDELKRLNPRFAGVPAVNNRRVYNATRRSTSAGGSDFWESGALRADRVLEDMIIALHPQRRPDEEMYYFIRLPVE
jgi:iron complex transport system substrate-binding protein